MTDDSSDSSSDSSTSANHNSGDSSSSSDQQQQRSNTCPPGTITKHNFQVPLYEFAHDVCRNKIEYAKGEAKVIKCGAEAGLEFHRNPVGALSGLADCVRK